MITLLRNRAWLYEQYVVRGISSAQIALDLDCSRPTVTQYLKKHGIPVRPPGTQMRWTERDDEILRREWMTEHSRDQIAEIMGRSMTAIAKCARILKLPARKAGPRSRRVQPSKPSNPRVALLHPNHRGCFNSAAVLERFLELKGAA